MKTIFFDTEFDNFANLGLISIGFYSECGNYSLYLENINFNLNNCSDFVKQIVIPKLNLTKYGGDLEENRLKFKNWINTIPDNEILFLADYLGDIQIFWNNFYFFKQVKKIIAQHIHQRLEYLFQEKNLNIIQQNNFINIFNQQLQLKEKEEKENLHHALFDAKMNTLCWNYSWTKLMESNDATHV